MTRPSIRTTTAHARRPSTERPAKAGRNGQSRPIDYTALAAALADLDAQAAAGRPASKRGSGLPATGRCHTCDRAVTGERRYCGPCAARRS